MTPEHIHLPKTLYHYGIHDNKIHPAIWDSNIQDFVYFVFLNWSFTHFFFVYSIHVFDFAFAPASSKFFFFWHLDYPFLTCRCRGAVTRCIKSSLGCSFQGPRSALQSHLWECPFRDQNAGIYGYTDFFFFSSSDWSYVYKLVSHISVDVYRSVLSCQYM